jgi:hydroxymethylbilane synthase
MSRKLRIGTRDSQLAVWQATRVQQLLEQNGHAVELVYMKSEGDVDLVAPLYAMGVQGVFTKTLDAALLSERIDLAVHSMKDVPTQLAEGVQCAAVLERASTKDILVYKNSSDLEKIGFNGKWTSAPSVDFTVATGSVRRIAQWLYRYPGNRIEDLRGNVNTRLRKLAESNWNGAIFAAAGLERIGLRPRLSIDLDWMLSAPAQGAIMVVCREGDDQAWEYCQAFHHENTALCTQVERDFLRALLGGCSTPISALAEIRNGILEFKGNIVSTDGRSKASLEKKVALADAGNLGMQAAKEILLNGGQPIVDYIRKNTSPSHGKA